MKTIQVSDQVFDVLLDHRNKLSDCLNQVIEELIIEVHKDDPDLYNRDTVVCYTDEETILMSENTPIDKLMLPNT